MNVTKSNGLIQITSDQMKLYTQLELDIINERIDRNKCTVNKFRDWTKLL